MLAPREWRVETSDEFDADREAVEVGAPRFDEHWRLWNLWLERRPYEFTHGLLHDRDEDRVLITNEQITGQQYVVGITVDPKRRVVTLRWLDVADMA